MSQHLRSIIMALVLGLLPCATFAQEESTDQVIPSKGDQFPIHITYFPALKDSNGTGLMNSPVVVLLHGEKESRQFWNKGSAPRGTNPFPVELQKRGYAVVTVDLRKHGESVRENQPTPFRNDDYTKMVLGDMAAVKGFLQEEHQKQNLNMRKMAIVASGFSAPVAAAFAENDWKQRPFDDHALPAKKTPRGQDVQALIFLSPDKGAGKLSTSRSLGFLKNPVMNVAFQVIVGQEDSQNFNTAKLLHKNFTTIKKNEERAELISPKLKDSGISLMRQPAPVAYVPMLKFLDDHLKTKEIPWQDRRSRLVR